MKALLSVSSLPAAVTPLPAPPRVADDEQSVWRQRAQEKREGGRRFQRGAGQHVLTLQVGRSVSTTSRC